ncbi:MAG: ParA family protein [Hyphomonadaceae bacterium]|nr:ParA family protein [Hyphomonadaceae bacterium]
MTTGAYLAYDPADEAAAAEIAAELERNGWNVTRAGPDLRHPENHAALAPTIAGANLVVLVASSSAEQNSLLPRETAVALNNGRPVIVVQAGDLAPDGWLANTLDLKGAIDVRAGVTSEALERFIQTARSAKGRGRVVSMLNIKGGVGKTVLAANLFAAAHLADQRAICFIDLDPQHNLTQYFLPPAERNRIRDEGRTIYNALTGQPDLSAIAVALNRAKRGKKSPRFDLVCGDERLFEFTLDTRSERDKAHAFNRFRALLATLREQYEAVIIDANPCATFLTRLAISGADHIVAPVRPEKYSLTGLNMLEHVVREVRGRPLRSEEFSVLLNGVNDRARSEDGDADALTRAEIEAAPFFGAALLKEEVPYAGVLRAVPSDRIVVNPINVTAMMRVTGRGVKEALTRAAAAVLRRAQAP